jgi:hypothetical protein
MVAVVPAPPLMVPQLAAGRAAETERMRAASVAAAAQLGAVADRWLVLGADPGGRRSVRQPLRGTFNGFGVDVPVALTPEPESMAGAPTEDLPLPLLIAGWLRGQAAPGVVARAELVPPDLATEQCRRVGASLAAELDGQSDAVGLLVVGDGANTHTEKAPGYLDRRAGPFDAAVADALANADPAGLLALDAALAAELNAVGRAPWQVLAGLLMAEPGGTGLDGHWRGELTYSDAPYGVCYHVAVWRR